MLGLTALLNDISKTHAAVTSPLDKLFFVIENIENVNRSTAILSASCLVLLIAARIIKTKIVHRPGAAWVRYIPEIFLVVVGMTCKLQSAPIGGSRSDQLMPKTVLAGRLRWDRLGVDILGQVSGGSAIPFGWPLDKRRLKYFSYTVSLSYDSDSMAAPKREQVLICSSLPLSSALWSVWWTPSWLHERMEASLDIQSVRTVSWWL